MAQNTDKFIKVKRKFLTTISSGGFTQGSQSLSIVSGSGLDEDTAIIVTLAPGEANEEVVKGVYNGNNTIESCLRGLSGTTDQAHSAGEQVVMYLEEGHIDDMVDGILEQHDQDGTHKNITATGLTVNDRDVEEFSPAGIITAFGGSSAPSGWLICDGSAVSRSTYDDLYAAIGTEYGAGDGTTTFNLPNLQGRVAVGKDSSTFNTLGDTGGSETTDARHRHLTAIGWDGNDLFMTATSTGGNPLFNSVVRSENRATLNLGSFPTNTARMSYTDYSGSTTENNLQPYQVINYIIKV